MLLVAAAVAPTVALLYYFYVRDKYEKEPRRKLIKANLLGVLIVLPVLLVEIQVNIFDPFDRSLAAVSYTAFMVAGLVEEGFKYLAFVFFFLRDKEFDEMYDGIVYSVFISLGFATVENIGYVLGADFTTALLRSLTAVPAHALFAVAMGYYLGTARFMRPEKRGRYMALGLFVPLILHGIYNFILLSQRTVLLVLFIPYMLYLWRRAFRNIDELVACSPYREPPVYVDGRGDGEEDR